jgi:hypothetical protein
MIEAVGVNLAPALRLDLPDMYCPALGGPTDRPNMHRSSCKRRLARGGDAQCRHCKQNPSVQAAQPVEKPAYGKASKAILAARRANPSATKQQIADFVGVSATLVGRVLRRTEKTPEIRRCVWCGALLVRKPQECSMDFKDRKTCDRTCSAKLRCAKERDIRSRGQVGQRKIDAAIERENVLALHRAQPELSHAAIAKRFGRSRSWINKLLRPVA